MAIKSSIWVGQTQGWRTPMKPALQSLLMVTALSIGSVGVLSGCAKQTKDQRFQSANHFDPGPPSAPRFGKLANHPANQSDDSQGDQVRPQPLQFMNSQPNFAETNGTDEASGQSEDADPANSAFENAFASSFTGPSASANGSTPSNSPTANGETPAGTVSPAPSSSASESIAPPARNAPPVNSTPSPNANQGPDQKASPPSAPAKPAPPPPPVPPRRPKQLVPAQRPVAAYHRAAIWSKYANTLSWTTTALKEIRRQMPMLERARDKNDFCPAYNRASMYHREICWLRLIGGLVEHESGFNAATSFIEANGDASIGLFSLSTGECKFAPTADLLRNALLNMHCGIGLMARLIYDQGFIDGPESSRGAASYWSVLRDPYRAYGYSLGRKYKIQAYTRNYANF